jgi:granule-bound starch synthase
MFIHAEKATAQSKWATTKTAFLCHNAVFQGRFEYEETLAQVFGVPESYIESITSNMPLRVGKFNEKVKCVNTMAAGLIYSDRALTVSPSYAVECARDPDKGVELEELFAAGRVTGILNGVKEGVSPMEENFVQKTKMTCGTFSAATANAAKEELKTTYQTQNNLPASAGPLMCFIGRLDAQKGYDLLLEALIDTLEDTEMQIVIVGAGRDDLVAHTKAVEKKFPGKFFYAGWMGPERYALLAGCDFTLLPSRWEPCGLVQMEAMRVGTCPIVAPTGGLKDTVEDGLNGLWTDSEMTVEAEIDEESVESIASALRRASKLFIEEPGKMAEMKKAAMAAASEFTWSNAALQYEAVFEELGVTDVLPKCGVATVTLETDTQVC